MSPTRLSPALLTTFALSALAGSLRAVPAPAPRGRVADVLQHTATWSEVVERADEIVGLGAAALPELFAILASGRDSAVTVGDEAVLAPYQRATAQLALRGSTIAEVRVFLSTLAEGTPSTEERLEALALLGRVGTRSDLDLLSRIAAAGEDGAVIERPILDAFEAALETYLRRKPTTVHKLPSLYARVHPSLLEPIVASVERVHSPEALDALTEFLGSVPNADGLVLRALARQGEVGRALPAPLRFRSYLNHEDDTLAVLAITAAARLDDQESVDILVRQLDHRNANVRRATERALKELTQLPFGADRDAWIRWHRGEVTWWDREAHEQFAALRTTDLDAVARAVLGIATKRLYPDKLATGLAAGLRRSEPQLVRMTCHALMQLPSQAAVADLIVLLRHENAAVREDALTALRTITGFDLPPDAERWQLLFGG